jgi:hypothetical protein
MSEIDLTRLSHEQFLQGFADTVLGLLRDHRVSLIVSRPDGVITFINPLILKEIPQEALAHTLLESWSEEDVVSFLEHVYG